MIPALTDCPADNELQAHLMGSLSALQADAIRDHLDSCDACRSLTIALVRAQGTPAHSRASGAPGAPNVESASSDKRAISRYQIQRLVGSGGMGVVYAAHDPALHRNVALKVLKPLLATQYPILTDRLMKESRLLARVSDPAVITVYDAGIDNDQVFLAMELIEGETLGDWFRQRRNQPPDWEAIVDIFSRAGAGLLAAHRAGVLHRDFKPDNVLIAPAKERFPKRVIVTDFGLALDHQSDGGTFEFPLQMMRIVDIAEVDKTALTATGMAVGTPVYMSPEQLMCRPVDVRSDVFAMGVSMWELLYGERPFVGQTAADLRDAIERGPSVGGPVPSKPPARVPPRLHSLVTRMVAYHANDRPQTVAAVVSELQRIQSKASTRNRLALGIGSLAVVAAIAVVATATIGHREVIADPCIAAQQQLASVWNLQVSKNVQIQLAKAGMTTDVANGIVASLHKWASDIGNFQQATCKQPRSHIVNACVDARLNELHAVSSVMSEVDSSTVSTVPTLLRTKLDPLVCGTDGVSIGESRWPIEQHLWSRVGHIRMHLFAIEKMRDQGEFTAAHNSIVALESVTRAVPWPAIVAEQQYVLASLEHWDIDPAKSAQTYRQAAALAESLHQDYIASVIWNAMSGMATMDESAPQRGMEYAEYATAASVRIGKPAVLEVLVLYSKATANIQLGNLDQAQAELDQATALAENSYPDFVATLIQGIAFIHETRGEAELAVRGYRKAIEIFEQRGQHRSLAAVINRTRLAANLSQLQQYEEALQEAYAVVALADSILSVKSADRLRAHGMYALILAVVGKNEDALKEIERAIELARLQGGERTDNFGKLLGVKAGVLLAQGNALEAAVLANQSCEIQSFRNGDNSLDAAICWADSATTLNQIGDHKTALDRIDKFFPLVQSSFKSDQAEVFSVHISRGQALAGLGRHDEAVLAFETGLDAMIKATYPTGFIADAQYGLAMALRKSDAARTKKLVKSAIARWQLDSDGWEQELKTAELWLRRH